MWKSHEVGLISYIIVCPSMWGCQWSSLFCQCISKKSKRSSLWTLEVSTSVSAPLSLCCVCLCVCVRACVCVCVTGRRDLNNSAVQKRLDYLNNVTTIIVFITTVLNFFISTFGMQRTGHFPWLMMRIHWRTQTYFCCVCHYQCIFILIVKQIVSVSVTSIMSLIVFSWEKWVILCVELSG